MQTHRMQTSRGRTRLTGSEGQEGYAGTHPLRLHLGQGAVDGRRVLSPRTVRIMQAPQAVVPVSPGVEAIWPSTHFMAYGLGWFLRDYRGVKVVEHGGNVTGMTAHVALVPEHGLGVAVLSSLDDTALPTALAYRVIDAVLGAPVRDWSGELLEATQTAGAPPAEEDERPAALPLSRYVGAYEGSLYGAAHVALEDDALVLRLTERIVGDLVSRGEHTFGVRWRDAYLATVGVRGPVVFEVEGDEPTVVRLEGVGAYARVGGGAPAGL